jgi:hypothetical protein
MMEVMNSRDGQNLAEKPHKTTRKEIMIKQVNIKEWDAGWFAEMEDVIDIHKPVEVYRNLHKKCWSVRQGGKVKVHTSYICLQDVKFVVQPAGREKVLKEKKKNVHAFVKGYLISHKTMNRLNKDIEWTMDVVTYNPYKHPYFTCGEFEAVRAELVDMDIDCVEDQVMGYSITIKAKKVEV